MNKRIRKGIVGALALAMATGAGPFAFAKDSKAPSGDMNLRLNGYEIVTDQVSILGIGQEVVSTDGKTILGDETFSYTDPTTPAHSGTCGGAIGTSSVTFQGGDFGNLGEGQFVLSLTFTPGTSVADTACQDTVYTLLCNRTLAHKNLASDLDAGQYHCVATEVTVGGTEVPASIEGHLDIVSGSNSPQS